MTTRDALKIQVVEALSGLGPSTVPRIAQHIWENHEAELRQSGDLFYTWQYAMRWAGQILQKEGKLSKAGPGRNWMLIQDIPMPVISTFFGIIIRMYHNDHAPPHFHASYQGFEALIRIADGSVYAGALPNRALRLVQDWTARHQRELLENWQRGVDLLPMQLIPGADFDD